MNQISQTNSKLTNVISDQLVIQQQQLINVLKQEMLRLQQENHNLISDKLTLEDKLRQSMSVVDTLNDKLRNVSENNQSLLRTVQVFQREFIKRDSNSSVLARLPVENNGSGQLHLEIIRNFKSKISNIVVEPSVSSNEKTAFAGYYGFFLQDQSVEENAITLYNEIVEDKRPVRSSKIRSLGKKNYFHENFRHVFWYNSIQNKQRINQKLYRLLTEQYEANLQNKPPKSSIIDLDLRRMDLKLDEEKSKKVSSEIKRLLQLFQLYRPDIKYVQGMSYLAWIFLIRMSPFRSFSCFCNLILSDQFVHALYMFQELKIKKIVNYFWECLEDKRPKLHKHLRSAGVDSQLFLIQWAYTLYSRTFSLRIVAKIWDLWFSQGYSTFYKVAMTVFELLQPELLSKNENDNLIEIVRTSCFKFQQAQFLRLLIKQKLFQELKFE